jgi:YhcH/YjgK/YiaL family protein
MIFDTIAHLALYEPLIPGLKRVKEILDSGELLTQTPGQYSTGDPRVRYNLLSYTTKTEDPEFYEVHQKEIDVQVVLRGTEKMLLIWREPVLAGSEYDAEKDFSMVTGNRAISYRAAAGNFGLFFPGEPHAPALIDGKPEEILKAVFKILL